MTRWLIPLALLLVSLVAAYYHSEYQDEKKRADDAITLAEQRQTTINDMTVRQRDVAALDAKYTGEIADARATIDRLERDVAAGRKRLQIAARCPANGTASTGGVGDDAAPRLTADAERDYWRLRAGIEDVTKQVGYLQDYINTQCLK